MSDDYVSLLEQAYNKIKVLQQTFVDPLGHTCATCFYNEYIGPNADADDCNRDDYDSSDPICVEDWWEDNKCIKWKSCALLSAETAPEPKEKKYISIRSIVCRKCHREDCCEVTLECTDMGKIIAANVTRLPTGWGYRPYGEAGGEAPYCPECLKVPSCTVCNGQGYTIDESGGKNLCGFCIEVNDK